MFIETISQRFKKVRGTNATDASFPSRLPQAARPSGIGNSAAQATASAVFDLTAGGIGSYIQNSVLVMPFGAGANNNTMSVRIYGWALATEGKVETDIYIPVLLTEIACTLSSTVIGLAGRYVVATDLFADTLTVTYGNANVSVEAVSPANDLPAHFIADLKGFELYEMTFTTGSSATNCNALTKMQ